MERKDRLPFPDSITRNPGRGSILVYNKSYSDSFYDSTIQFSVHLATYMYVLY